MISLPALRYAVAVARHGSFSAAARDCAVSQPTISNAIADLEDVLGARLFERTTRKLGLTPAGETLLPAIQAVITTLAELEREAHALTTPSRKLVRIGFSPLVGAQRLGRLLEPFGKAHAEVELVYKECSQRDMEARLDAGTIDVVCGTRLATAKNRGRQLLYREALRWVPPHGVVAGARVEVRRVARTRLVLTDGACGLAPATREIFARARAPIDEYAGQAISYAVLEEWADLGIGGAILPTSHVRSARSAALEHDAKPVTLAFETIWRRDLLVAKHVKAFVTYLRTVVPKLVKGSATTHDS